VVRGGGSGAKKGSVDSGEKEGKGEERCNEEDGSLRLRFTPMVSARKYRERLDKTKTSSKLTRRGKTGRAALEMRKNYADSNTE